MCSLASLQCQDAGLVPSSCDLELPGKSVCHRVAKKKNLGLVNNREESLVAPWICCGGGPIPGTGTPACHGHCQKKEKIAASLSG